jgi:hypothetical protein
MPGTPDDPNCVDSATDRQPVASKIRMHAVRPSLAAWASSLGIACFRSVRVRSSVHALRILQNRAHGYKRTQRYTFNAPNAVCAKQNEKESVDDIA